MGAGRDITDILYNGEFVTIAGDCTLQGNIIFAEIFTEFLYPVALPCAANKSKAR